MFWRFKAEYDYGDFKVDLYPLAKEAIAYAPHPEVRKLNAKGFAKMCVETFDKGNLPKAFEPAFEDREALRYLQLRVIFWANFERRKWQFADLPEKFRNSYYSHREVRVEPDCCDEANKLAGQKLALDKPIRFPLRKCRLDRCLCESREVKRPRKKRG